jgi:threonine/homoserine/homoserine lactone efflux protein
MPDLSAILAFITAAVILLVIPGPAVLYIITRSTEQGTRAGLISVCGIQAGTLVHAVAAAFGVSAILMASAMAFALLKYAGAGYLIYLGCKKIFGKKRTEEEQQTLPPQSMKAIFWQGMVVNVLNPKCALFFFAFLPQFINPATGNVTGQVLFFGLLFTLLAFMTDGSYALAAGRLGKWLKGNRWYLRLEAWISGLIYISLGLLTLMMQPSHNAGRK